MFNYEEQVKAGMDSLTEKDKLMLEIQSCYRIEESFNRYKGKAIMFFEFRLNCYGETIVPLRLNDDILKLIRENRISKEKELQELLNQ